MHEDKLHTDVESNEILTEEVIESEDYLHPREEHLGEFELPHSLFHHGF
jgi:hypothetical protein